jgi:ketosteroid isomerase-like protein
MKTSQLLLALAGMLLLNGCAVTADKHDHHATPILDMEAVKSEIQKLENNFIKAEQNRDADGVVAYYAEDAVSYGPNMKPLVGKKAIRDAHAERFKTDTLTFQPVYNIVDLYASDDMVVEVGSWEMKSESGETLENG